LNQSSPAFTFSLPSNSTSNINYTKKHVSYILLSEFDILKGSQLTHQYPQPTNIKGR
jgi:hypothetical protein